MLLFCLLGCVNLSRGVRSNDLFPFGSPAGDERLPADAEDISSPEVSLATNVKFFDREYGSIYVSIVDKHHEWTLFYTLLFHY